MTIVEKLGITPGPWGCFKNGRSIVGGYGDEYICETMTMEDAEFIAAAPEMLEALIECRNELAERFGEVGYSTVDNATAIIEKATGKTWAEIKELLG